MRMRKGFSVAKLTKEAQNSKKHHQEHPHGWISPSALLICGSHTNKVGNR
jgi:hypothetical protein